MQIIVEPCDIDNLLKIAQKVGYDTSKADKAKLLSDIQSEIASSSNFLVVEDAFFELGDTVGFGAYGLIKR